MSATVAERITVTVPKALWMSENDRLHWQTKRRKTAALRALGAAEARRQHVPKLQAPVHVMAHIKYPTATRADPNNANSTTKPLVDGFTDAGVWDDDDGTRVLGPDHRRAPGKAPKGCHVIEFIITSQAVPF